MFCPHCGTQYPENAKFCPECGKNFDALKDKSKKTVPLSVLLISIISLIIIFVLIGIVIYMITKSDTRENNQNITPTLCPILEEQEQEDGYSEEVYQNNVDDVMNSDEDSVEDLFGSWTDKENLLSLSFLENGEVRISDKTGLIGVEFMTYSITGEGTLKLKAKTDSILGLLSYDVKYNLKDNTMSLEILSKTFELHRK